MVSRDRLSPLLIWWLVPLGLYLIVLALLPTGTALWLSFSHPDHPWVLTLQHYSQLLGDRTFHRAFWNTVVIASISVVLELGLGLGLALALHRPLRWRTPLRVLLLLPLGVPTIVAAANLRYVFDQSGWLNELLLRLHLISQPIAWTDGGVLTIVCIIAADLWKVTPLVVLLLLTGLQTIPHEQYEAARVDGANARQQFRWITWPLLRPFMLMALVVRGVDAFRIFELPLALAGRSTPVMSFYAYTQYRELNNPHLASAASIVLLVVMVVFLIAIIRRLRLEMV